MVISSVVVIPILMKFLLDSS